MAVKCERCSVEHDLVLPADVVRKHQRQAGFAHPFAHPFDPFPRLAHVIGRGIDDQQGLGPGRLRLACGARKPGVFANQESETHAAGLEHQGFAAGCEVALLVEHLVVRQFALGIGRKHATVTEHRRRVVALLDGDRTGAVITTGWMADHHPQTGQRRQLGRQFAQLAHGRFHEGAAHHQILRRIAGQRQFRRQQHLRARGMGAARRLGNALAVAGEIADREIELRNG